MAKEVEIRGLGTSRFGKRVAKTESVKSFQFDKAKEISTHGMIKGFSAFRMVKSPAKAGSVKSRQVDKAVTKVAVLRRTITTKLRAPHFSKGRISRAE